MLIDNRTDFDDLTLRLESEAGQRLREVRQTREKKTVEQLEELPPAVWLPLCLVRGRVIDALC